MLSRLVLAKWVCVILCSSKKKSVSEKLRNCSAESENNVKIASDEKWLMVGEKVELGEKVPTKIFSGEFLWE